MNEHRISLTAEQATYIDSLVAAGTYATADEVIRASLEALQERDAGLERWLHQEVAPVFDAMLANPGRGIPASKVAAALDALHTQRERSDSRA